MTYAESITIATIFIYGISSLAGIGGLLARKPLWRRLGCHFALAAFFFQTFTLILGFHKSPSGFLTTGAWLQLPAWFILLCASAAWWRLRAEALLLLATPLCFTLFLMSLPWLDNPLVLPTPLSTSFYILHTGAIFLSLGLFSVAFIAGLIFIKLEKRIKTRKIMNSFWKDMPHLEMLDRINAVCVLASFPLYTLGIITGLLWSAPIYGKLPGTDPKECASIFIWLLLATVFHNRLVLGWKGHKPALFMILIFILSLFSLAALNFLLPGHHSFAQN